MANIQIQMIEFLGNVPCSKFELISADESFLDGIFFCRCELISTIETLIRSKIIIISVMTRYQSILNRIKVRFFSYTGEAKKMLGNDEYTFDQKVFDYLWFVTTSWMWRKLLSLPGMVYTFFCVVFSISIIWKAPTHYLSF